MSYTQLSADERLQLYQLKQNQLSNRAIARRLRRAPSTISRELARNQSQEGIYLPDTAQQKRQQRRQAAKSSFEGIASECIAEVQARLQKYHSPQQIAGRLKREGKTSVSHDHLPED